MEYGAIDARGMILLAGLFAGLTIPETPCEVTCAIALERAPAPADEAVGVLSLWGSALAETLDVPCQVPVNDDAAGSVGVPTKRGRWSLTGWPTGLQSVSGRFLCAMPQGGDRRDHYHGGISLAMSGRLPRRIAGHLG